MVGRLAYPSGRGTDSKRNLTAFEARVVEDPGIQRSVENQLVEAAEGWSVVAAGSLLAVAETVAGFQDQSAVAEYTAMRTRLAET